MSDAADKSPARSSTPTRLSDAGRERVAERQARQAEALRANLRRRKEQLRARADKDAADDSEAL
ncbi:hypothetical protein ACM64Y_07620 [Novispirillum sp. DQ9]|uniref:hypothetical protein n=1 Tax=Novispirillum sp. DQ9 TaxID=3398612 RepID=UPI003C7B12E8